MRQWIDKGDYDSLAKFIENENTFLKAKSYIKTGNMALDAVLNTKCSIAEEKEILFTSYVEWMENSRISDMDLVCVLGNLIDNAIEASERTTGKKYIEVIIKREGNVLIIKVMNLYAGVEFEASYTSKEEKAFHGIGLKSVRRIAKKYHGSFELTEEKDEIIATVVLSGE